MSAFITACENYSVLTRDYIGLGSSYTVEEYKKRINAALNRGKYPQMRDGYVDVLQGNFDSFTDPFSPSTSERLAVMTCFGYIFGLANAVKNEEVKDVRSMSIGFATTKYAVAPHIFGVVNDGDFKTDYLLVKGEGGFRARVFDELVAPTRHDGLEISYLCDGERITPGGSEELLKALYYQSQAWSKSIDFRSERVKREVEYIKSITNRGRGRDLIKRVLSSMVN